MERRGGVVSRGWGIPGKGRDASCGWGGISTPPLSVWLSLPIAYKSRLDCRPKTDQGDRKREERLTFLIC